MKKNQEDTKELKKAKNCKKMRKTVRNAKNEQRREKVQNVQKSSNSTRKAGKAKRNLKIVVDFFYFFFYFYCTKPINRARLQQAKMLAVLEINITYVLDRESQRILVRGHHSCHQQYVLCKDIFRQLDRNCCFQSHLDYIDILWIQR